MSDEDEDSNHPIFDFFLNAGGSESIVKLINFSPAEFRRIYVALETHISANWNIGRGRKFSHLPMDVLFIMLSILKHGGTWDFQTQMFRIKPPTFQRMIICFREMISKKA